MRTCFFIPSLGDGGAQRQCIALLNALQQSSSVELHLILLGSGEHEASLDTSRLQIHRIQARNFASFAALAFVTRTLHGMRPDLIISWLHPADILAFASTRFVRGIAWAMTERDSVYPDKLVYNARKRVGRKAKVIIANSQRGSEMWKALAPGTPVVQIPNIVLAHLSAARSDPSRSTSFICLSVGRLEPQKNVLAIASAFAEFATEQRDARLHIVGTGSESNELARIAQERDIGNRLQLLGFRRDVPELMSQARLLISLSRHEGMPNVVMEAVASGLPAVVSDIPEHRALLGDDYPFYAQLDLSDEEIGHIITNAWMHDSGVNDALYGYARNILASMTPERVKDDYLAVFAKTIARASIPNSLTASAQQRSRYGS